LIEQPGLVKWHCRYIVKLNVLLTEGLKIFYLDETLDR
jgi:hypothetical protein